MTPPRILIGSPRYGDEVVAEAFTSKNNAERNDLYPEEDHVQVVYDLNCKGSLLNFCFNQIFAEALNRYEAGAISHFAMIHSDVSAPAGWLNKLWSIMRQRGDVVVSAVVSIKEPERSRTSTAVGNRYEHFDVRRYITATDRHSMPETFCTADVAQDENEVLLVNTGLWLADLSWPGFKEFAFSSRDTIMRNPANNKYQAFVVPEDWNLAYHLDEMGAPYSATWSIQTRHIGPSVWDSHELPVVQAQFVPSGEGG